MRSRLILLKKKLYMSYATEGYILSEEEEEEEEDDLEAMRLGIEEV
jgi:hypothetical protein